MKVYQTPSVSASEIKVAYDEYIPSSVTLAALGVLGNGFAFGGKVAVAAGSILACVAMSLHSKSVRSLAVKGAYILKSNTILKKNPIVKDVMKVRSLANVIRLGSGVGVGVCLFWGIEKSIGESIEGAVKDRIVKKMEERHGSAIGDDLYAGNVGSQLFIKSINFSTEGFIAGLSPEKSLEIRKKMKALTEKKLNARGACGTCFGISALAAKKINQGPLEDISVFWQEMESEGIKEEAAFFQLCHRMAVGGIEGVSRNEIEVPYKMVDFMGKKIDGNSFQKAVTMPGIYSMLSVCDDKSLIIGRAGKGKSRHAVFAFSSNSKNKHIFLDSNGGMMSCPTKERLAYGMTKSMENMNPDLPLIYPLLAIDSFSEKS